MAEATQGKSPAVRIIVWGIVVVVVAVSLFTLWQTGDLQPRPRVALITADDDAYWDIAIDGAQDAADTFEVDLVIHKTKEGAMEQVAVVGEMVGSGVDGIAISPVDVDSQVVPLRNAAAKCKLVTLDSDIPVAGRLCFVGADNYNAGRECASLVKRALPDGGRILLSVGSLDKENGRLRRQGIIDELLERAAGAGPQQDPLGAPLVGPKYTIVATLVDDINPAQARLNVLNALQSHDDIDCIVGLYGYSTPAVLDALREADKLGELTVIGFDYPAATLAGIESGEVFGTMAQDPYMYGFNAVRILSDSIRGRGLDAMPIFQQVHYPTYPVTQQNLANFRQKVEGRPAPAASGA